MNENESGPTAVPAGRSRRERRRVLMLVAIGGFVLAGAAFGAYRYWSSLRVAYTDDAYVAGDLVQITPQVAGTVTAIYAHDTESVHGGQPLVRLDGAAARVALREAEARLGAAVRALRVSYARTRALQSMVPVRRARVATAQAELAKAEDTMRRRQRLAGTGAVGAEEIRQAHIAVRAAKGALASARAEVAAARAEVAANAARTAGTPLARNPTVLLAAARVRAAYLALARTVIPAPIDGEVARRTVQLGRRVTPGMVLMNVVPLSRVWVDANFKETQLGALRVGQAATVRADIYGSEVTYHGKVVGISAGSGAAFALLPAQNATGNWIKVVQRVPVRVALDPDELARHPLRVGLSAEVTVDIVHRTGPPVGDAPAALAPVRTRVYRVDWQKADALIARIIAANAGSDAGSAPVADVPRPANRR